MSPLRLVFPEPMSVKHFLFASGEDRFNKEEYSWQRFLCCYKGSSISFFLYFIFKSKMFSCLKKHSLLLINVVRVMNKMDLIKCTPIPFHLTCLVSDVHTTPALWLYHVKNLFYLFIFLGDA